MSFPASLVARYGIGCTLRVEKRAADLNLLGALHVYFGVVTFFVWCVLFVLCWPLALVALIAYPVVWILLLPFRLLGIAVDGALGLVRGLVMLPARLLRGPRTL